MGVAVCAAAAAAAVWPAAVALVAVEAWAAAAGVVPAAVVVAVGPVAAATVRQQLWGLPQHWLAALTGGAGGGAAGVRAVGWQRVLTGPRLLLRCVLHSLLSWLLLAAVRHGMLTGIGWLPRRCSLVAGQLAQLTTAHLPGAVLSSDAPHRALRHAASAGSTAGWKGPLTAPRRTGPAWDTWAHQSTGQHHAAMRIASETEAERTVQIAYQCIRLSAVAWQDFDREDLACCFEHLRKLSAADISRWQVLHDYHESAAPFLQQQ